MKNKISDRLAGLPTLFAGKIVKKFSNKIRQKIKFDLDN